MAVEAYLEQQRRSVCAPAARSPVFSKCPTAFDGVTQGEPEKPAETVLPPLLPEEQALTDEELERRANIKGIQPFNLKF
jgi:hypothetical protein